MKNVLVLIALVACVGLLIMSCENTPPATQNSLPDKQDGGTVQGGTDCVGAIGGAVYGDLNCDGILDNGELGISGVTVELREGTCPSSNPVIATTVTGADGSYLFTGLQQYFAYCVTIVVPPGGILSTPNPKGGITDDYYILFGLCSPPQGSCGRMTGGGSVFTVENARVTRGFEIHCDLTPPNNIEVNWPGGNNFHMTTLTNADCTDDPLIIQAPPAAPFDTFTGDGVGKLNNVDGATIHFVFVDAGEPGKYDTALIIVRDTGGNVVLNVFGYLKNGNLQAHDDGCN